MTDFELSKKNNEQVYFDYTDSPDKDIYSASIKVIGAGGGGGNALGSMFRDGITGVELVVANTDAQALKESPVPTKMQIGRQITKGLGAGGRPDIGRAAALEDAESVRSRLDGADMVFITAGMGGGTGTGAAPVIASIAKEMGALTVGIVTKPFSFEGRKRSQYAEQGLVDFRKDVNTLITIPNQQLLGYVGKNMPASEAFTVADSILCNAVKGISELITVGGLVNLDFADVKTIMSSKGMALMGSGFGTGENRSTEAAHAAVNSPLLEDSSIEGATGILINITGGPDMSLFEIDEAVKLITDTADDEAEIIFGTVIRDDIKDSITVTVIATGFGASREVAPRGVGVEQFGELASMGFEGTDHSKSEYIKCMPQVKPSPNAGEPDESMFIRPTVNSEPQLKSVGSGSDEDLDVPTFIRKHAD